MKISTNDGKAVAVVDLSLLLLLLLLELFLDSVVGDEDDLVVLDSLMLLELLLFVNDEE